MIKGFEEQTSPLTKKEEEVMMWIVPHLKRKIGPEKAITNKAMTKGMKNVWKVKISGPRMRKIINQIRIRGLVPRLVATSKGYYVEQDNIKLEQYIESLDQRIKAIQLVRDSLIKQKSQMFIEYEL